MYFIVKRLMDVTLSLFALLLIWPLFILISLLIKLDSKGPVYFRQKRVGENRKEFNMLKFRTMRTDTPKDTPTHLLQNPEKHITNVGKFLRKTSLDELPQLLNILKGEMSIVGPRPALWNQYDLLAARERNGANKIQPGLTGWAQVNGRDELELSYKAKLDGEYADKIGFVFDIRIILKTLYIVLVSDGVVEGKIERGIKDGMTVSEGIK